MKRFFINLKNLFGFFRYNPYICNLIFKTEIMLANEKILKEAEKKVLSGIMAIKTGKKTPAEAGLGKILNSLKTLDEPLYEELMKKYKETIK